VAEGGHEVLQRRRRLGDSALRGPLGGARGEDRGEERVEAAAAQQVGGVDEARVRQVCEEHRAPLANLRRARVELRDRRLEYACADRGR